MALFQECMPSCAQKVFDTADIVRDGDFSAIDRFRVADHPQSGETLLFTA